MIVVPGDALKKQWITELHQHDIHNVQVYTANYFTDNKFEMNSKLLIVDELHEFYSEERSKIIDGTYIKYKFNLFVTGTLEDPKNRHLKVLEYSPLIDYITEDEAIKNGWVSQYIEYNLGIELTEERRVKYQEYSDEIARLNAKFGKYGFELASKCLQGGENKEGKFREAKE
jgi:superfamily II DNA or RNA helicase